MVKVSARVCRRSVLTRQLYYLDIHTCDTTDYIFVSMYTKGITEDIKKKERENLQLQIEGVD